MKTSVKIHNFLRNLMIPLQQIDEALPKQGLILDLGCGEGAISAFLAQKKQRNVIGIDIDKKRLQQSSQKNLKFIHGDATAFNVKNVDGIVISDVLHHINFQDQEKLLENIARNIKKGGVVVIKEIDTGEFVRSWLSRLWDFVFYPTEKIYFSNAKDLTTKLTKLGFSVKIRREYLFFPGSTTLFVCTKR
ncbi:MAG: class I SAM-dependent methyltransferase [Candidatus Curtissbacteria bacterium]